LTWREPGDAMIDRLIFFFDCFWERTTNAFLDFTDWVVDALEKLFGSRE
jgi:hypothetical protein